MSERVRLEIEFHRYWEELRRISTVSCSPDVILYHLIWAHFLDLVLQYRLHKLPVSPAGKLAEPCLLAVAAHIQSCLNVSDLCLKHVIKSFTALTGDHDRSDLTDGFGLHFSRITNHEVQETRGLFPFHPCSQLGSGGNNRTFSFTHS